MTYVILPFLLAFALWPLLPLGISLSEANYTAAAFWVVVAIVWIYSTHAAVVVKE